MRFRLRETRAASGPVETRATPTTNMTVTTAGAGYGPSTWAGRGAHPSAEFAGVVVAAVGVWSSALAAAAPDAGPLTPYALADCGRRLASRGEWSALVEIGDDGELILTPFDATPRFGVWTGQTRERDGIRPRAVQAPADMVFHVELAARPLPFGASTRDILTAIEGSLAGDLRSGLRGRAVLTMDRALAATGSGVRDQITKSLQDGYTDAEGAGKVPVLPPGVEPASMGGELDWIPQQREQLFGEVEALFGIPGLLRPSDGQAAHAAWRLATVRTFTPLARQIEDEARAKLDEPYTLNRDAWFAASHSERARLIAARAGGVSRLVNQAGMQAADALATVRSFDAD